MTEKRFTIDDGCGQTVYWHIKEDGIVIGNRCGQKHIAYVVERLNELYEENERLKQQLKRLYNYFEDWSSDMISTNDFNEIWDSVKEDEGWG